jgi:hypothetical protein
MSSRLLRLAAIVTAAGAFSGLFGVGGAPSSCRFWCTGWATAEGGHRLSPLGVLAGVALANAVSERTLELSFAAVQLIFAWQLAGRAGLR